MFPPTSTVHLDPHSEEYYQKLVEALELDTQAYSHVRPEILTQFKALIRKYPMAFHLPGAELHPVTGFHHNISTGDSPPVYCMPYRKSPAELIAAYALVNDGFLSTGFHQFCKVIVEGNG